MEHSDDPFPKSIIFVAGPTASGKSKEAIRLAKLYDGEIISVDSRQVYRSLDIGTEKLSLAQQDHIPHHLIDIRDVNEQYSAGDFVGDADTLIRDLLAKGKTPILAGGSHFYFDAFLYGVPTVVPDEAFRASLEKYSNEELFADIQIKDPDRAEMIDSANRRRLVRTLEIINAYGIVPSREPREFPYHIMWVVLDPSREELRERIDARLTDTLSHGLMEEVVRVRENVGDERLNELGLEYRIVGEYLRGERTEASLFPALSSKLWHYARHQKAWLRKLKAQYEEYDVTEAEQPPQDRN